MAQKFVSLDDAAEQLGISKDRLNDLREAGKVRAYRDGTSWKFRAEDVEKLVAEGIPAVDPAGSDLSMDSGSSAGEDSKGADRKTAASISDIALGDESEPVLAPSDISLDELDEPTVPVDALSDDDQVVLSGDDEIDDVSDSILLSETELGESTDRPPSTIIGKAEMSSELDLELAASESDAAAASDVQLVPSTSDIHTTGARGEAVLDTEPPGLSDNFGDLEEVEIDLEAESSRILAPEDVSKARQAAAKSEPPKAADVSDLELAPSDSSLPAASSSGGGVLDSVVGKSSSGGLTGLSALELEGDEDDEVLGDGSDITLSSESSGINIISPSDSGLALDEVPLELSPIAVGSSLDLGGAAEESVGLEPLEVVVDEAADAKIGEPFTLTPFGEEAAEEEEDSSQVIPLDEVSEEDAAGALLGAGAGEGEALPEDFAVAGLPAGAMAVAEPGAETPFPAWIMVLLGICMVTLPLCGMMMVDLLRNMWSWSEPYTLNSAIMDSIASVLSG